MVALTSAQKQARRYAELDAIAQAAGWPNWTRYATAVKRGVVSIETNPARRATGKRGGRGRKETMMKGKTKSKKDKTVLTLCTNCNGAGRIESGKCNVCGGKGVIEQPNNVSLSK